MLLPICQYLGASETDNFSRSSKEPVSMTKRKITIVGLGASITEAKEMADENKKWLNIVGEKLRKSFPEYEFNMVNSGKGGNSAREAMARFENGVLSKNPDYVILDLCANNFDPVKVERRVNMEEFKSILEQYKKSLPSKTKTVCFTIPPMYEDIHPYGKNPAFKEFFQERGGFENAGTPYKDTFREFAKENGFPLYDFYYELLALGKKNGRERYIYKDGIHMNEEGNMVLAEGIFKILQQIIMQKQKDLK